MDDLKEKHNNVVHLHDHPGRSKWHGSLYNFKFISLKYKCAINEGQMFSSLLSAASSAEKTAVMACSKNG